MKKEIIIYDIDVEGLTKGELNSYKNKPFCFEVDIYICTNINDKLYNFRCSVANQEGLNSFMLKHDKQYCEEGVLIFNNYNLLLIDNFSFKKLEQVITSICKNINTVNKKWNEIAKELSHYFWYEYHYLL
jgi:hypothetical protein